VASLTELQADVLRFIREYTAEHGYPPSMRDIKDRFGWSGPNAVNNHIVALEKKGYLRRTPRTARSFVILEPTERPHADEHLNPGGAG
jgi:repressor LexA